MTGALDDLAALEEKLREKWGDFSPKALDPDDEAIAARLLGKSEAKRLANTPSGARFKYRRPKVRAEYFWVPAYEHPRLPITESGFWAVDVLEDGRRRRFYEGTWELCRFIVKAMEERKIPIRFAGGPVPLPNPAPLTDPQSPRRRMLEEAGRFKP